MGPTPEVRKMMAGSNAITFTTLDVYKLIEVSSKDLAEGRELFPAKDMSTRKDGAVINGAEETAGGEVENGGRNGELEALGQDKVATF